MFPSSSCGDAPGGSHSAKLSQQAPALLNLLDVKVGTAKRTVPVSPSQAVRNMYSW